MGVLCDINIMIEILNTFFAFLFLVFAGFFAYYSAVLVEEQKNFSRKTTRRK